MFPLSLNNVSPPTATTRQELLGTEDIREPRLLESFSSSKGEVSNSGARRMEKTCVSNSAFIETTLAEFQYRRSRICWMRQEQQLAPQISE